MAHRLLMAVCGITLAACHDHATVAEAPRLQGIHVLGDPDSTAWNRFDVDVVVTYTKPGEPRPKFPKTLALGYHITKRRQGDGRWMTEIAYGGFLPKLKNRPMEMRVPPIARAVFDGDNPPQFYDARGRPISTPDEAQAAAFRRSSVGAHTIGKAPARPAQMRTAPAAASPDEWVDHYLIGAQTGARIRQRLTRSAEGKGRQAAGWTSYVVTTAKQRAEVRVNDATGAIEETRVTDAGRLSGVTERRFQRSGSGVLVLTAERITRYPNGPDGEPLTMEVSYRNLTTSKEN